MSVRQGTKNPDTEYRGIMIGVVAVTTGYQAVYRIPGERRAHLDKPRAYPGEALEGAKKVIDAAFAKRQGKQSTEVASTNG